MRSTPAERSRQIRSRWLIRSWEYRQRNHARGVWFELRRVLAQARRVLVVSEADARSLVAEGYRPEPVGTRLEPQKMIFFLPETRAVTLPSVREVAPHLDAELLDARAIVLVPFR